MRRFLLFLSIPIFLISCEKDDDPFVNIQGIENLIYESIRNYRIAEGEDGPFVHQYFIVGQAQVYSAKMATGVQEVNTDGIQEHWDKLDEKYSFYNQQALVLKTIAGNEDEILDELILLPDGPGILLSDVSQCGVGTATDSVGYHYITVLLAKAD